MLGKESTFFERTKKSLRTMAFNRGVHRLQKNGDAYWKSPPMWNVETEHEKPHFFRRETALAWAARHHVHEANVKEVEAYHSKTHGLCWYSKQRDLGMDVGNDAQQIGSASLESVDDMIAWFKKIERFDTTAAYNLLALGFAADRPDVTNVVAEWAVAAPWAWFNWSHMSGATGDPFGKSPRNDVHVCLFSRCLSSVALTEWLFEHQPHLKAVLLAPDKWTELQKGLEQADPEVQAKWPWIAHHVFGIDIDLSPLDYERCQKTLLNALDLHRNFAHDPASQCYISYKLMKTAPWGDSGPHECSNPEVHLFHQKLRAIHQKADPALVPTTPLVDNLMIAVYLDMAPNDFYLHAQQVFDYTVYAQTEALMIVDDNIFT